MHTRPVNERESEEHMSAATLDDGILITMEIGMDALKGNLVIWYEYEVKVHYFESCVYISQIECLHAPALLSYSHLF